MKHDPRHCIGLGKAVAALKRAQKAADEVVKAPWPAVFKKMKGTVRELRSVGTQQAKLRKQLCGDQESYEGCHSKLVQLG